MKSDFKNFYDFLVRSDKAEWLTEDEFDQLVDEFLEAEPQSEARSVSENEQTKEVLKPKYCSQCGEPINKPHKFWCSLK